MKTTPHFHLLVFCPLYPPHIGGLESHAQQFNREMSARGHSVTVFTPLVTANTPPIEKEGKVKIYRYPAFEIIPNYPVPKLWHPLFWKQLHHVVYALRVTRYSLHPIIISRTRFFLTSLMALLASKTTRIPWLHIEHGSDFVHLNNPIASALARIYDHTLGRLVFLTADTLVANSKASAAFVNKFIPKKQVSVIYRGVNIEAINRIPPLDIHKTYNLKPDVKIITFCGRLIDGKGVHDLIAALALLKQTNWHCFIIGDGPQRSSLERQSQSLKLSKQITFHGEASWENAIAMLKSSDIAVNPSYTEGLPTSVIEATICQTAIIASNVGGTAEIIEDQSTGLLFYASDRTALSQYLDSLINNTNLRNQLSTDAYKRTLSQFNWKTSAKKYEQIIRSI